MAQWLTVEEMAARLKITWVPQDPENPNRVDPLDALADFAVSLWIDQQKKKFGEELSDQEDLVRWDEDRKPVSGEDE